jgi:hypothetical protein
MQFIKMNVNKGYRLSDDGEKEQIKGKICMILLPAIG